MTGFEISGADETAAALRQAASDAADLDATLTVAEATADVMRGFIPVDRGTARSTIRASKEPHNLAVVTFGGERAPHGFPIARNHPSRFVAQTDRVMETRAAALFEDGISDTLTKNGLT